MVALRLTGSVIALHAAALLTLAVLPDDPPKGTWMQMFWASTHHVSFYVLTAALIGSPILTILALPIRGRHRVWLAVSWAATGILAGAYYTHRLTVMMQIFWEQA